MEDEIDPTRRKNQTMQDIQPNAKPQGESTQAPDRRPTSGSRFNESEYERWSERLRNMNKSKGK
jgi:hypothetical protein